MVKSFNTDAERNAYFSHLATIAGTGNTAQYVDGVLCVNNVPETDKVLVARMELMFDSLNKLAALNEVVA